MAKRSLVDVVSERKAVPVSRLRFDVSNPRLFGRLTGSRISDVEVVQELAASADLRELIDSIAANGYIDIEPLVVLPAEGSEEFVVLEGNRRLAALRVLAEPSLRRGAGLGEMPSLEGALPERVSVCVVGSREAARALIGFKHINGPHRWDSYAKGRYATDWYLKEQPRGASIREIARQLGDRHDAVRRLVNGILVLDQARDGGLFTVDDRAEGRTFAFSHLYTAITRPGFQAYLGLPGDWRQREPERNPVPKEKLPHLERVLKWIYGSREDSLPPQVTSQNPHVRELDEILGNPRARQVLEATGSRVEAFREVRTPAAAFETALVTANLRAEEALSKVAAFEGEPTLLEAGSQLKRTSAVLFASMQEVARGDESG